MRRQDGCRTAVPGRRPRRRPRRRPVAAGATVALVEEGACYCLDDVAEQLDPRVLVHGGQSSPASAREQGVPTPEAAPSGRGSRSGEVERPVQTHQSLGRTPSALIQERQVEARAGKSTITRERPAAVRTWDGEVLMRAPGEEHTHREPSPPGAMARGLSPFASEGRYVK